MLVLVCAFVGSGSSSGSGGGWVLVARAALPSRGEADSALPRGSVHAGGGMRRNLPPPLSPAEQGRAIAAEAEAGGAEVEAEAAKAAAEAGGAEAEAAGGNGVDSDVADERAKTRKSNGRFSKGRGRDRGKKEAQSSPSKDLADGSGGGGGLNSVGDQGEAAGPSQGRAQA